MGLIYCSRDYFTSRTTERRTIYWSREYFTTRTAERRTIYEFREYLRTSWSRYHPIASLNKTIHGTVVLLRGWIGYH